MREGEVEVVNRSGLHARPAVLFVAEASRHRCVVEVENLMRPGKRANAKSLLSLLTLGVSAGHRVRIRCEGPDEDAAFASLAALVASGLGEAP